MSIRKIDGVNWVERTIPTATGDKTLVGMTVRALRAALADCDPDDLVCYMAEQTPESREVDLILGVIGGLGHGGDHGVAFLFGPEANNAIQGRSA